ncbi:MAG: sodium:proton antiporter [Acidimicrobiales bacterium]|nr:sodium:proton antiporter [Acidimicrobiales bacterium]
MPAIDDPEDDDRSGVDGRESPEERLDRELNELLGELRIALPGVQVVFAFLLTVPFTGRFHDLDTIAKDAYLLALVLVGVASVLLMAPTVHHRLRFRHGTKEEMITTANRLALAAMVALALGLGSACYVAAEGAMPGTWARWIGPAFVVFAGVVWLMVPLKFTSRPAPPREGPGDAGLSGGGGRR